MNPDLKNLLSEFNARGVEYLVVGAYTLAAHGHIRATGDLDSGSDRHGTWDNRCWFAWTDVVIVAAPGGTGSRSFAGWQPDLQLRFRH